MEIKLKMIRDIQIYGYTVKERDRDEDNWMKFEDENH